MHIITGGNDVEQRRDGDYLDHDERYARTDEYLPCCARRGTRASRSTTTATTTGSRAAAGRRVRPDGAIPLFFGGASADAVRVGGKHADIYMLWGEPLDGTAEQIASGARGRGAAGRTETRVQRQLPADRGRHRGGGLGARRRDPAPRPRQRWDTTRRTFGLDGKNAAGSQRLLGRAAKGDLHDSGCGPRPPRRPARRQLHRAGRQPEKVADAILDYVDIGVNTVLIRGYEPLADAYATTAGWSRSSAPGARDRQVA